MAHTHSAPDHHGHAPNDQAEGGAHHIGWKKYVVVFVMLAVITGVEVAIFYIEAIRPILMPVLVTLSAGKFILVVQYYMHLKMDHPIFGRVFWAPLSLAVLVVLGMIVLFKVLPRYGVFS
ncbi:MAG TPA: cytochrome C oxidase subunit IV family protein [Longimicrobiales bacterium]|nr:cytochrome C oxidase subunit IV family protein [Longimicrobiales bacterium]